MMPSAAVGRRSMRTSPTRRRSMRMPAWVSSRAIGAAAIAASLWLGTSGPVEAASAEAVDRSALRVCADPSNLPFSNDKGEGFANTIAELLAKALGVTVDRQSVVWGKSVSVREDHGGRRTIK